MMKEFWSIIIAPRPRRISGGWNGPFPVAENDPEKGSGHHPLGNRDVQVQYGDARHALYIEALIARKVGSDNTALRTALTFVANLSAGRPALTFGYAPAKKGALQMTTASRLAPNVFLSLQYLIRNFFRIENVVSVRLAKSIHKLPLATYAYSCTLAHYDNGVNPGLHYYEAEGTSEYSRYNWISTFENCSMSEVH
eukprot:2312256-Pyramimonas_sp.AAC.1